MYDRNFRVTTEITVCYSLLTRSTRRPEISWSLQVAWNKFLWNDRKHEKKASDRWFTCIGTSNYTTLFWISYDSKLYYTTLYRLFLVRTLSITCNISSNNITFVSFENLLTSRLSQSWNIAFPELISLFVLSGFV